MTKDEFIQMCSDCGYCSKTVDAEPVRRGEWVLDGSAPEIDMIWYHCSCCGAFKVRERTPYCPQCGAKMDVEGEK